ncbi:MAG: sugar transferase [Candidatus Bathyarchaeia archaeon]
MAGEKVERGKTEKGLGWQAQMALKRAFDIVFSAFLLILLSPSFLLISLLIWLTMGRPILFRQPRIGYKGRVFTIYKFRTMNDARDAEGNLLPDEQRLTRVGKLLRSLTLDELPELFNVLRGDMSIVGPRPLLVEYRDLYTPEQ